MIPKEYVNKKIEDVKAFRIALTRETDRGCALFATSYLDKALSDLLYCALTSDKKIENDELSDALEKCINNLPEKYAMVFRMKTIEQYETEDICKELDISSSNLWVIIHRARTQLRKCMEDNWFKN